MCGEWRTDSSGVISFYCTEATLFSDYYNVGESYDHQLSLLLDGYTRKDINPHSFDSLVTPGAIDVQQGMWAASCTGAKLSELVELTNFHSTDDLAFTQWISLNRYSLSLNR